MIDAHGILIFVHIVLMSYWLGGDLGVFLAANRVADPALPFDERMRFMKLLMILDMAPRTALVLMLPVGFHMAVNIGLITLPGWALGIIWASSVAWLVLTWVVSLSEGKLESSPLPKLDLWTRYLVLGALIALGILSLATGAPIFANWLAVKLLLFAGIITLGLLLRGAVAKWVIGFGRLAAEGSTPEIEAIIGGARKTAARQALLLWGLVLVNGFLGVTQPF